MNDGIMPSPSLANALRTEDQLEKLSLNELASFIREQAQEGNKIMSVARRDVATYVVNTGRALNAAKSKTPPGTWEAWVKKNCGFAASTARMYQQIARHHKDVNRYQVSVSQTVRGLRALAAKAKDPKADRPKSAGSSPKRKDRNLIHDLVTLLPHAFETLTAECFENLVLPELDRIHRLAHQRLERRKAVETTGSETCPSDAEDSSSAEHEQEQQT